MFARTLVVPLVALLMAVPQAFAANAPGLPATPPPALGSLTHAALADASAGCGISSVFADGRSLSAACGTRERSRADADPSSASGSPTLEADRTIGTVRWYADLAARGDGSFIRVHGYGDVVAAAEDGTLLWRRPATSLLPDWGIDSPVVPTVPMGEAPTSPTTRASERPYAVGDVTGDGLEDVAVSHIVTHAETESVERRASQVTVFDGADGATLWTRRFPGYVTQVVLDGNLLILGQETGDEQGTTVLVGEDGSRTSLIGLRLSRSGDGINGVQEWTHSTDTEWTRWLAAEPAGEGRLAAARMSGSGGVVSLIDLATGAAMWSAQSSVPPMNLRYDEARDLVVVHEQTNPSSASTSYVLRGLAAEDGSPGPVVSRPAALLLSLEVADVAGGPEPEWLTGDLAALQHEASGTTTTQPWVGRVRAADPAVGTLWSHDTATGEDLARGRTGGTSMPEHFGLTASGDRVITSWFSATGTGVAALDGDDGSLVWEHFGDPAFPVFLTPHRMGDTDVVLAGSVSKLSRAFRVSDGKIVMESPALADVYAARTADVNGDGTSDLLVGGEGEGVFALDGADLDDDPAILWHAVTDGPVHQLHLADLDGDGADEIVAVASWGVDVLELADGALDYRIPVAAPDVAWAITIGDVDGDDLPDLVVPTRTLDAYRGTDGAALWAWPPARQDRIELRFAAPAIEDGVVVTQFLKRAIGYTTVNLNPRGERFLMGLDAATGAPEWLVPQAEELGIPRLWRGVLGTPEGVAMTWETARAGVPVQFWKIETDIVDPATGEILANSRLARGSTHTFLVHEPDYGLFEGNWLTSASLADDEPLEIDMGSSRWEASSADFGELGRFFLMAGSDRVLVYPPGLPLGEAGTDAPPVLAEWVDLAVGRFEVVDLDADGSDEVIALRFDWPMYSQVHLWEGTATLAIDDKVHGVAVLEAR